MQSAWFKLHYFWSSPVPSLINASGKDVWQWLEEGIDFAKGSLHINQHVNDKSLNTNPNHPICLFMWPDCLAPKLGPDPSFTWVSPAIPRVCFLPLNWCQHTESTSHSHPPFRPAFIQTFHNHVLSSSAVLAFQTSMGVSTDYHSNDKPVG